MSSSRAPAPSRTLHPVFRFALFVPPEALPQVRENTLRAMRGRQDGGTEAILEVVVAMQPKASERMQLAEEPKQEGSEIIVVNTSSASQPRPQPIQLTVALIFRGTGRVKRSVKETVKRLIKDVEFSATELFAIHTSLQPSTFGAIVRESQEQKYRCEWFDGAVRKLSTYLLQRIRATSSAEEVELVQNNMDLLGPGPGKRKAPPLYSGPMKRIGYMGGDVSSSAEGGAASSSAEGPSRREPEDACTTDLSARLAEVLKWDDNLSKNGAAERADSLLSLVHDMALELSQTKHQLMFYKQEKAHEAQVSSLFPLTPMALLRLSVAFHVLAQLRSRSNLQIALKKIKSTSDELLEAISKDVQKITTMCAPLRGIAGGRKPPNLQLIYFHAAALTKGENSYPW